MSYRRHFVAAAVVAMACTSCTVTPSDLEASGPEARANSESDAEDGSGDAGLSDGGMDERVDDGSRQQDAALDDAGAALVEIDDSGVPVDGGGAPGDAGPDVITDAQVPCVKKTYYKDSDGDSYGDAASSASSCTKPVGYVLNSLDCYDQNKLAKPGQVAWYEADRGDGSFDYDCNGEEQLRDPDVVVCYPLPVTPAWQDTVPGCGIQGAWRAVKATGACDVHRWTKRQACH